MHGVDEKPCVSNIENKVNFIQKLELQKQVG